jgi:hypothetical protein
LDGSAEMLCTTDTWVFDRSIFVFWVFLKLLNQRLGVRPQVFGKTNPSLAVDTYSFEPDAQQQYASIIAAERPLIAVATI